MAGKLEGKVSIITGASSGMGKAAALMFSREGAKVVVGFNRNMKGGEETVKAIKENGGDAILVKVDVSKASEVEEMVKQTIATYGRLDCAFNNAGVEASQLSTVDCTEEAFDRSININLKGIYQPPGHSIGLGQRWRWCRILRCWIGLRRLGGRVGANFEQAGP